MNLVTVSGDHYVFILIHEHVQNVEVIKEVVIIDELSVVDYVIKVLVNLACHLIGHRVSVRQVHVISKILVLIEMVAMFMQGITTVFLHFRLIISN